jgi:hypothetical protein
MPWKQILLLGDAAVLSDTAPVDVTKAAAEAGTATEASRQDHKHNIATATPGSITPGDTPTEGTATSVARSDHKHGAPSTYPPGSHALSGHSDAVASVPFNEQEATALALENAATNPSTSKAGRIVFNSGDNHPYVYTP